MKPKSIGIIGGAGPQAGIFFLQQLINHASRKYGCYRDSDFPEIVLINFPFSEMLEKKIDKVHLRQELASCLKRLRDNGATILAIACNTLHVFLEENEPLFDLIHLPILIKEAINSREIPLVLCTSTSSKFELHKKFFPCAYPDLKTQAQVDAIINETLKGSNLQFCSEELKKIIEKQNSKTIVLGCTELSLFTPFLFVSNKQIIDPVELAVKKILSLSFSK